MKLILLSGGSGKRLWPLSNDSRSKQFLRILEGPNGQKESMVERVWRQLGEAGLQKSSYIAAGKAQEEIIQAHLGGNVPLIIEPERRDTFPAIALASVYLYSAGVSLDEVVTILPVDPYVDDSFFRRIADLEIHLKESESNIALLGVTPTYPSEKYGYILPERESHSESKIQYKKVSRFIEKPREKDAIELLKQDALWNCGVFSFKLSYLINLLIEYRIPIHFEELLRQYHSLTKNSFDYEVVEKAGNITVLPFDGFWKDLGTWNTLTEEMNSTSIGKVILSKDSTNTHVINELGLPITVIGMPNAVVAASPDGILVSEKVASPRIKDLMKHIDQRPMYEERRWGHYFVIDHLTNSNGEQVMTKRVCLEAGHNFSYHFHNNWSEVWTFVAGEGEMFLDGILKKVKVGDHIEIPKGCKHSLFAHSRIEIIEVMRGQQLVEEDKTRIEMNWDEILQLVNK